MNQKDLYMLLYLAQKTRLASSLQTSTGKIAVELGVSQQTVSRKLVDFSAAGMIDRIVTPTGVEIRISPEGRKHLFSLYDNLHTMFEKSNQLTGTVKKGLGEGRFYMQQEEYKKQFSQALGFVPFPGTLNISVNPNMLDQFLATKEELYIKGFETKQRSFGGLKCFKIIINGEIEAAVIIPDRTMHKNDTVEVIAEEYLRETLKIKDGTKIMLE
jgi:riboflavin kinase, archaea type